jgi:hypothetical protein
MQLTTSRPVADMRSLLARQWHEALRDVVIRHPNQRSKVLAHLTDDDAPVLRLSLDFTYDSRDRAVDAWSPFTIAGVKLTYFPGVKLAREWLAAAFSGYCQHEALELVTVGGLTERPLDPHAEPFAYDRGLRDGLPPVLNRATLIQALAVVMPTDAAVALAHGDG